MGDNIYLGDRDGVRTPMQWTPDRNGGFSRADPQRLYLPPIMDPIYGYEAVNVEAQQREPASLLNWMKRLIAVRQAPPGLRPRHPAPSSTRATARSWPICASTRARRSCASPTSSRSAQAVELDLSALQGRVPVELLGRSPFPPIGDLPYLLTLPGHGFYWFVLAEAAELPRWHEPMPGAACRTSSRWCCATAGAAVLEGQRRRASSSARSCRPSSPKQRWFARQGPRDQPAARVADWAELGGGRDGAPPGRDRGRPRRRRAAAALLPAARDRVGRRGPEPWLAAAARSRSPRCAAGRGRARSTTPWPATSFCRRPHGRHARGDGASLPAPASIRCWSTCGARGRRAARGRRGQAPGRRAEQHARP